MALTGGDATEATMAGLLEYYERMEMLIALLIAQHGEPTEGGFRMILDAEEVNQLRRHLGTDKPVVLQTYDAHRARHVIDVL